MLDSTPVPLLPFHPTHSEDKNRETARGEGEAIHITNPIMRGEIEGEGWQRRERRGGNEREKMREGDGVYSKLKVQQ